MYLRYLGCCLLTVCLTACSRTLVYLPTPINADVPTASGAPNRWATIAEHSGTVNARAASNQVWAKASRGQKLSEGSQIHTSEASQALVTLSEGSKIRLAPNTAFTFNILNQYLENQITSIALDSGTVWLFLTGGAFDVETQLGVASARTAYMSVAYDAQKETLMVSCLRGTCSFSDTFIPGLSKMTFAKGVGTIESLTMTDLGEWGQQPEATQFAFMATEAVAQGNATLPVVETATPAPTLAASATSQQPSATPLPPTTAPTQNVVVSPAPSATPTAPRPTALILPTNTLLPFTPIPPAPTIGQHLVGQGETLFCIARVYGVLPASIAQANGLNLPFNVFPGQVLKIPAVQWREIIPGPVCAPQFTSPFPGLPFTTPTPLASATPAGPPLVINIQLQCTDNCGSSTGTYTLRLVVEATGGVPPYTYTPDQTFDVFEIPHCQDGNGTVTVTSADGQTLSQAWTYHDPSCTN